MKYLYFIFTLFLAVILNAQCGSTEILQTNWTVHGFSTEEASGEGANNGRAVHSIDGNINTFWHSRWQNFTPQYPHFIEIDMGENRDMNGLSVTSRNDTPNIKPKNYELYLSSDGVNWGLVQSAGILEYPDLSANGQTAEITFGAVSARYFKLIFTSNYDDNVHIAISEINAFEISGGPECVATGQNNQVVFLEEIEKHYTTDAPFTINATSSTDNPIMYEIVSGPATVSGNVITLTGEGGTVVVRAFQNENSEFYEGEDIVSFEVVDLNAIQPEIHTRLTESYPIEMPPLYSYKLTASSSIAESQALSVENIEFRVNGELLESVNGIYSSYAWWTPASYGQHTVEISAIASNGNILTESYTLNVTNEISSREVVTLQNAVIDWGSTGSQWYYGTYELPQFTGAYDNILAEFNVTCPSVPGGCDDWDRLGYLQIKNPDGEWIELIRYITPYGVACSHELDVTDYASVLQGEVEFRMYIETWGTGGWEMELKLHYNQGTPEFIYSEIQEIWQGTYNFGDLADLQPVPTATVDMPENTEEAEFRVVTTGHGWGSTNTGNAAEFYYANHHFNVNGTNTFDQAMRTDCNPNPDGCTGQMGTWQYDRAGWCPGTIAKPYIYNITPFIDAPYSFDYEFQLNYVDLCHPNNPECVTGVTCSNCNDGYNPHYRIAAYNVYRGNSPLGTLATQEITNDQPNKLTVYPNPSNGLFRVDLAEEMEKATLQIYSVNGEALKRFTFANRSALNAFTFSVNDLPAGIYFIKIYNQNQMAAAKLILK